MVDVSLVQMHVILFFSFRLRVHKFLIGGVVRIMWHHWSSCGLSGDFARDPSRFRKLYSLTFVLR